jgi:hypothetical protein
VPKNNAVKERLEELTDLTDEEAATLDRQLREIVKSNRRPFSRRIVALRAILARLRPEPVRASPPSLRIYAPPSKGRYRRRG